MVLIAGVVCDDLSVDSKRACAERHLKKTGILESEYHSSYTYTAVSDTECEPYIKSISKTYDDKLRVNFSLNVQTAPLVECIISGMAARKATEYDMASNYFDDLHLHDKDKELKYKLALTEIVQDVAKKCAE